METRPAWGFEFATCQAALPSRIPRAHHYIRTFLLALSSGNRLGPYEIVGPLGAGGMGEV